jgi:hypothetical protein
MGKDAMRFHGINRNSDVLLKPCGFSKAHRKSKSPAAPRLLCVLFQTIEELTGA